MTTINTSDEKILKEDLVKDIYFEGKAVKVYGKIYGLTNLGRTFFISEAEVKKADKDAQAQMMQKYGAEIYGRNAQLSGQKSSGTFSSSGYSEASGSMPGGLISCTVEALAELPDKFFEAKSGDFKQFGNDLAEFEKYINNKLKDDQWKQAHGKDAQAFLKSKQDFRGGMGPTDASNMKCWKTMNDLLKNDTWEAEAKKDGVLKKIVDKMRKSFQAWQGKEDGGAVSGGDVKEGKEGNPAWNPKLPFKITIQTNFDENWFKRKYKSGMLNGMIMAIKTATAARSANTVAAANPTNPALQSGHKFTADEMLPSDLKKLDGIKWKMTNKVAKDYVNFLLGWSRKKEATQKTEDGKNTIVPSQELKRDSGVGSKFAKNALSGRGILGRLRQKLFAGGQSSNQISVAFQLADWNDGWKIVDEKTGDVIDTGEGKNGKEGQDGKGGKGDASGKGGGSPGGSGNGGGGKSGTNGGGGKEANIDDKQMQSLMSLLQRVERLEDEVGVGQGTKGDEKKAPEKDDKNNKNTEKHDSEQKNVNKEKANESSDPFWDLNSDRSDLVREVCEGKTNVDDLIEKFLDD